MDYELMKDVPSGLCGCRLGEVPMHVWAISPRSLVLRTPEEIVPGAALRLTLYEPSRGIYREYSVESYQIGEARRENGAVLTRFLFDDAGCAEGIRRMMRGYARYLQVKSEEGAAAYATVAAGYPENEDERFHESLDRQLEAWFGDMAPIPEPGNIELAIEINRPELWHKYLRLPLQDFCTEYARLHHLPEGFLPRALPRRLYIGSSHCRHLFPDEALFGQIARKAACEGLQLSLLTAEMRAGSTDLADLQIRLAREWSAELVIGDWGLLQRVQPRRSGLHISLGIPLNRRRKDPRMNYKQGLQGREDLLNRGSFHDPAWVNWLQEMGVERLECESIGAAPPPEGLACSLHLPFYRTNTALWCPTRALCEDGRRGMQADRESCPAWCSENVLLYPAHLNMLGRFNSLIALDSDFHAALQLSYDRWVLNF